MTSDAPDLPEDWQVRVVRRLSGGDRGAWLCAASRGGLLVVKRCGAEAQATIAALKAWPSDARVRLLAHHGDLLLMECLRHDLTLDAEPAGVQVRSLAQLARRLRVQAPAEVPDLSQTVGEWGRRLATDTGDAWDRRLSAARRAAMELLASTGERTLLHGDLHPGNVLRSPHGWKVIDPQPAAGDPAYDAEPVLRRALDGGAVGLIPNLVDEMGLPEDRTIAWAKVRAAWYGAASARNHDRPREARWARRLFWLDALC